MKNLKPGEKRPTHPWCYAVSNLLVQIVKSVKIFMIFEFSSSLNVMVMEQGKDCLSVCLRDLCAFSQALHNI